MDSRAWMTCYYFVSSMALPSSIYLGLIDVSTPLKSIVDVQAVKARLIVSCA